MYRGPNQFNFDCIGVNLFVEEKENSMHKLIAIAGCAASLLDTSSSMIDNHNPNIYESNPIIASPKGRTNIPKLAIFHGASCIGGLYLSMDHHPMWVKLMGDSVNIPQSIIYSTVGIHNLEIKDQRSK